MLEIYPKQFDAVIIYLLCFATTFLQIDDCGSLTAYLIAADLGYVGVLQKFLESGKVHVDQTDTEVSILHLVIYSVYVFNWCILL